MPQVTNVLKFPRQTLANLCEPSREQDEALLRVIAAYEAEGGQVLFSGEGSEEGDDPHREAGSEVGLRPTLGDNASPSPNNFVSEYLTRPLRTEDEARAQLNRPRIPRAKGLLEMIAEQSGLDAAFKRIIGG